MFWDKVITILTLVIVIVVYYFVAKEFYKVAEMKGYSERRYFWIPFLLGVIGYLLVVALPDKKTRDMATRLDNIDRSTQVLLNTIKMEQFAGAADQAAPREIYPSPSLRTFDESIAQLAGNSIPTAFNKKSQEENLPKSPMTLKEHLEFSLKFQTDKGTVDYLQRISAKLDNNDAAQLSQVLNVPITEIRDHIILYLKTH